jgi:hypothetical protein
MIWDRKGAFSVAAARHAPVNNSSRGAQKQIAHKSPFHAKLVCHTSTFFAQQPKT